MARFEGKQLTIIRNYLGPGSEFTLDAFAFNRWDHAYGTSDRTAATQRAERLNQKVCSYSLAAAYPVLKT